MTPLMFGPGSRQLFGLYHAPDLVRRKDMAVLICAPFGQEALRTHRFFKVMADRLARAGVAVLRFDYYGAGDSPGHEHEGELDGWRRDVCAAHEELRRLSGPGHVVWVGARLGATLAALAARSGRCDPERLVLWEPIVHGPRYLQQLRESHVEAMEVSYCIPDPAWRRQLAKDPEAFTEEALGSAIAPALRKQLQSLRPDTLALTALHRTVVLSAPDDDATTTWVQAQQARNMPVRQATLKHPIVWSSDPHPNSAMVPADALQRLMTAIHE